MSPAESRSLEGAYGDVVVEELEAQGDGVGHRADNAKFVICRGMVRISVRRQPVPDLITDTLQDDLSRTPKGVDDHGSVQIPELIHRHFRIPHEVQKG
jgi:hypothetical protein